MQAEEEAEEAALEALKTQETEPEQLTAKEAIPSPSIPTIESASDIDDNNS